MPLAIGDVRTEARGEWLMERVASTGSLVVRKLGENWAGEIAVHRFLSSPYVSPDTIVGTLAARTAEQSAGRHIVAIQDTTEINFAGRSGRRRGFGPAGNGRDPGYFIHAVIAVDVEDEAVIARPGRHGHLDAIANARHGAADANDRGQRIDPLARRLYRSRNSARSGGFGDFDLGS